LRNEVLPALKNAEGLADDLMRYVFAGLDAVAKEAKAGAPAAATAGKRR
jgi:TetR/AcrR family transcriptional regulator, regulator of cefoperazone and chloramphenicol sensitivity